MKKTLLTIVALFCFTASALAVDVEEVVWGFDGRVVPFQFNPVNVLVSNTTEEQVSVVLELRRSSSAAGDRAGARVVEEVFLSPFSSRWVQFYPYISNSYDEWRVSWGRLPSQGKDLKKPKLGPPARVALVRSDQLVANKKTGVKSLSDELFPTFVSATQSLEALYVNHVPNWQEARRRALLDWVKRGGTMFLAPTVAGEYPVFTGELTALNSPLPTLRLGQGQVIRVESIAAANDEAERILGPTFQPSVSTNDWNLSGNFFTQLRWITNPEHNWPLIHLMSWVYLGLVFPGWYLVSRRPTHFRTTIFAFLGIAALFTLAFNIIGRRGYGESTTVNSIAIARQIEAGSYDVTQWTNVFVTSGDAYELSFDGNGDLFSTGPGQEKVRGVIDNGVDGRFVADVPLFSSRAFLHRGNMKGPEWKAEVVDIETSNVKFDGSKKLSSLRLKIEPMPKGDRPFVAFGKQIHYLREVEGAYQLSGRTITIDQALAINDDFDVQYPYYYGRTPVTDPDRIFTTVRDPLVAQSFELGIRKNRSTPVYLPTDRIRLFLYEDMPQSFSVKHAELQANQGKVLYSMDLWVGDEMAAFPKAILENQEEADEYDDDEEELLEDLAAEYTDDDEDDNEDAALSDETENENADEESTDNDE